MERVTTAPKTDSFHFRINPEIRREAEAVYEKCGLTLTQAIHIFIQQSLRTGGFPFPVTADNAELARANALKRLVAELEAGKSSGQPIGEEEAYRLLGVEQE